MMSTFFLISVVVLFVVVGGGLLFFVVCVVFVCVVFGVRQLPVCSPGRTSMINRKRTKRQYLRNNNNSRYFPRPISDELKAFTKSAND